MSICHLTKKSKLPLRHFLLHQMTRTFDAAMALLW
jgi:hypothetical protein